MVNFRDNGSYYGHLKRHVYRDSNQCQQLPGSDKHFGDGEQLADSRYNPGQSDILRKRAVDCLWRDQLCMVNIRDNGSYNGYLQRHVYSNRNRWKQLQGSNKHVGNGERFADSRYNPGQSIILRERAIDRLGRDKLCLVNSSDYGNNYGHFQRHLYRNGNQCQQLPGSSEHFGDGAW